ncbi:MAG: polysaccharide pyruvyl transferase family protein [Bdellovibrionales bacterium]
MIKTIALFDTSIATDNAGDEIIMDAVRKELMALFPDAFYVSVPTHDTLGKIGRELARKADLGFVGGSNLLCPNWLRHNQWKIGVKDFWRIGHPLLMGAGWVGYGREVMFPTGIMFRHLFRNKGLHAVRDSYTLNRLLKAGVSNVLNTACPTMWTLTPEHCARLPKQKADSAVITVTGYSSSPESDGAWIKAVCDKYKTVYFWPQMVDDEPYLRSLVSGDKVVTLGANLRGYDELLKSQDVDFIGTRLHGGIRALQHGRRAIILAIDNRATEIAKDTNFPTVSRSDIAKISSMIDGPFETDIKIPQDKIAAWKGQFAKEPRG